MVAPALTLLKSYVRDELRAVDRVIMESADQHVPLITQITSHLVHSGGKRIRPSLTLACSKLLDTTGKRHINLAATVELIHTATLLHDDVVDESTMRRGQDTANAVWSNQASVLVGDFLLSRAFQLMVADGSLNVLALLSGSSAIIAQGEVKQLAASGNLQTNTQDYLDIINAKTATLFSAACEIASHITNQPDLHEPLKAFGTAMGMAFQLVDDALDYSASSLTLGKTIGDDLREGKVTLPVIHAYAHADEGEQLFWQRVIEEGEHQDGDIDLAINIINRHKGVEATGGGAGQFHQPD